MAPSASGFQVVSLVPYPQFAKIKDPVLVYSHGSQQYNIIKYLFINQQFFAGSFEVCEISGTRGFFFLIFFFPKKFRIGNPFDSKFFKKNGSSDHFENWIQ